MQDPLQKGTENTWHRWKHLKEEERSKDSSLAEDLVNQHGGWQRVVLLTALHPTNEQQPGLALWDPALTMGWAEPSSTRTQQGCSPARRLCLPHGKVWHGKGWNSRQGARGTLGLGCSPGQRSPQDQGGRAARSPPTATATLGAGQGGQEGTAHCRSSAVGGQRRGLAHGASSPQPGMAPRDTGRNRH